MVCENCGARLRIPSSARFCYQCRERRAQRAATQPLQLRRPVDPTDFTDEPTQPGGVHRPAPNRYNVETERTDTRATMRIPLECVPDDIGADGDAYDYIIYEYGRPL